MIDAPATPRAEASPINSPGLVIAPDLAVSVDVLVDILKRRGIGTVYYFHTDHYEPWSSTINDKSARAVDRFAATSRRSRFGRRLSLFYAPFVPYDLDLTRSSRFWRVADDPVAFLRRSPEQEGLARQAVGALFADGHHEPHLHVHHEFWTRNDSHFPKAVSQWVNAHSTAQMDSDRLDLFFRLCKDVVARELGSPFEQWAFIHGNWALAASDPLICTVENELSLIMRHGGFGDFSFPAGRSYCDPKLEAPFTCVPLAGRRVYDESASAPRAVAFGAKQLSHPDRFFIWNSSVKATYSSLDYYTKSNRDLLHDPARILAQWLEKSVLLEGCLFIKTHAHSMKWEYDIANSDSLIPHCYPDTVSLFEHLLRVCDRAGVAFRFATVNEVMSVLKQYDAGTGDPDVVGVAPTELDPEPLVAADVLAQEREHEPPSAQAGPGGADRVVEQASVPGGRSSQEELPVPPDVAAFTAEFLTYQKAWSQGDGKVFGADELYASKLSRGIALEPYEAAIVRQIVERYEPGTAIAEIGTGYGALALLLAANGYRVEGYDGDRRRAAAATWVFDHYVASHARLAGQVKLLPGYFPAVCPTRSPQSSSRRRLAVATNVTCTYTAANQDAVLDALAREFDEVILDLARFGSTRNSQAERDALRSVLEARGFQPEERLYVGNPNEYWRFLVAPAGSRPAASPGHADQPLEAMQVASSAASPGSDMPFPLSTAESGVLFRLYGDRHIAACPVCHGRHCFALWRMPMATLKTPISVFGGYFNQIPTLQVPGTVYCFDFCRDCESIFLNPAPASQKEHYRKTDHYIRTLQADSLWQQYESAFDRFSKWIPPHAGSFLDAACGIGPYLEIARRREPARWRRLVGLELSEKYVEHMRGRGLEAYAFDIDNDDLLSLLAGDRVDFIAFCEAFEHVERPLDALEKLLSVLRPGGRLYFTAQRYGSDVQAAVRPGEPIYIGEKVVKDLPRRLGCRVLDVKTSGMRYYVVLEK